MESSSKPPCAGQLLADFFLASSRPWAALEPVVAPVVWAGTVHTAGSAYLPDKGLALTYPAPDLQQVHRVCDQPAESLLLVLRSPFRPDSVLSSVQSHHGIAPRSSTTSQYLR